MAELTEAQEVAVNNFAQVKALRAERAELVAALNALQKFVIDLSEQSDANAAEYLHRVRREHVSQVMNARALLAKLGE